MVGVVEADADELADRADAGADAARGKGGKCRRVEAAEALEALRRQDVAGDVVDDAGEVVSSRQFVSQTVAYLRSSDL